jgi:hypothetical protein
MAESQSAENDKILDRTVEGTKFEETVAKQI